MKRKNFLFIPAVFALVALLFSGCPTEEDSDTSLVFIKNDNTAEFRVAVNYASFRAEFLADTALTLEGNWTSGRVKNIHAVEENGYTITGVAYGWNADTNTVKIILADREIDVKMVFDSQHNPQTVNVSFTGMGGSIPSGGNDLIIFQGANGLMAGTYNRK